MKRKILGIVNILSSRFFLAIITLFILYPICFMLFTSFKTKQGYYQDSYGFDVESFTFENYTRMFIEYKFAVKISNSIIVSLSSAAIVTCIVIPAAYYISIAPKLIRHSIIVIFFAFSFMPEQVILLSKYRIFLYLGIIDTRLSVIVSGTAFCIPSSTILLMLIYKDVPDELLLASKIMGCNNFILIIKVLLPICRAGLIIVFLSTFNNVWFSLLDQMVFLQSDDIKTIMPALATLSTQRYASNVPYQMAGFALSLLPSLLSYIVLRKKIVEFPLGGVAL